MDKTRPLDNYFQEFWSETPDLTIAHAAFWMQIGSDPVDHKMRCMQDDAYHTAYCEREGGADRVLEKCHAIARLTLNNIINITEEHHREDGALDFERTTISKSDWTNWCRTNGYRRLADRFEHLAGLVHDPEWNVFRVSDVPPGYDFETDEPTQSRSSDLNSSTRVPGKLPKTSLGKLVVEIAWNIQRTSNRPATTKAVMLELKKLADEGKHATEFLIRYDKDKRSIVWRTSKGAETSAKTRVTQRHPEVMQQKQQAGDLRFANRYPTHDGPSHHE